MPRRLNETRFRRFACGRGSEYRQKESQLAGRCCISCFRRRAAPLRRIVGFVMSFDVLSSRLLLRPGCACASISVQREPNPGSGGRPQPPPRAKRASLRVLPSLARELARLICGFNFMRELRQRPSQQLRSASPLLLFAMLSHQPALGGLVNGRDLCRLHLRFFEPAAIKPGAFR